MIQGTAHSLFHNEGNNTEKKDIEKDLGIMTGNQKKILDFVKANPYITQGELSVLVGINSKNIRNNIAKLKSIGLLSRTGPNKGGY